MPLLHYLLLLAGKDISLFDSWIDADVIQYSKMIRDCEVDFQHMSNECFGMNLFWQTSDGADKKFLSIDPQQPDF